MEIAVSQGLINLLPSIQLNSFHQSLTSSSLPTLSNQLRCIAVGEWQQNYSGFLIDCDVVEEAQKFLQPGMFNSDLGDTVLLSLANALSIPVCCFHNNGIPSCCPQDPWVAILYTLHIHILDVDTMIPLLVIMDDQGSTEVKTNSCTCGKNASRSEASHCVPRYTTTIRCTCLRNGKPCTMLWRCKDCRNEYGQEHMSAA